MIKKVKKLTKSLVPEGVDYEDWIITASAKDLAAEMQYGFDRLEKVLKKPKKKNA